MTTWYKVGTVSVTTNSTTVTGAGGTAWVANVAIGDAIHLPNGIYEIASVVSNTSITLASVYLGSTDTGVAYKIQPTRGILRQTYDTINEWLASQQSYIDGPLAGRFENGTAGEPGIAFASDVNTGIYRVSADKMAIVTNGIARATIDSTDFLVPSTINGILVGRGGGNSITNVAIGSDALIAGTSAFSCVAVGYNALKANISGVVCTAVGRDALLKNTTANANTAVGALALAENTTGASNTAVGNNSLKANTTASNNTAVGNSSLQSNTTGANNTAVGHSALRDQTTGSFNAALGSFAGLSITTGERNVAVGHFALDSLTTGLGNVAVGAQALQDLTTGGGNTVINPITSAGAHNPVYNPTTADNNRFVAGSTAVTNAYVQVAWTVVSDERDKTDISAVPHGLAFVDALEPVAYRYRVSRDSDEGAGPLRYGFLAQDILALEGDAPVIIDDEDPNKLKFNDQSLVAVLVQAVQELSARVRDLEAGAA